MRNVIVAGLLLFSGPAADAQPANPDTWILLVRNPWGTLDPALADDVGAYAIIGHLYEPLIGFDKDAESFRPWLSAEVPARKNGGISADGLTIRFRMRSGASFHDGSPVTAEDARYSFVRDLVLEEAGGPSSLLLRPLLGRDSARAPDGTWAVPAEEIERAISTDGRQLVIRLKSPFPGIFKLIASWPIVASKACVKAKGGWNGVLPKVGEVPPAPDEALKDAACGSGPYKLARASQKSGEALLERNEAYWGEKPRLGQVYIRSEPSDALRASRLLSGDADYVYLERPHLGLVRGMPGIEILDGEPSSNAGETIFLNFDIAGASNPRIGSGALDGAGIPPDFFKDRAVRLAFARAFDEAAYLKSALAGKGERATGPVPPSMLPGGPARNFSFDLKEAEKLFRSAYGGKLWTAGFRLTAAYPRGSVRRQIAAELIKAGVEGVNKRFKVDLEAVPAREYPQLMASRALPVFIHTVYPDYPDAHAAAFAAIHSKGFYARAQGFADPELDALEERAAAEPDPEKRRAYWTELQNRAAESGAQIYTYAPIQFKAVRSWMKGFDARQTASGLAFYNLLYFPPLEKKQGPQDPLP